jgi:hypothetical protein
VFAFWLRILFFGLWLLLSMFCILHTPPVLSLRLLDSAVSLFNISNHLPLASRLFSPSFCSWCGGSFRALFPFTNISYFTFLLIFPFSSSLVTLFAPSLPIHFPSLVVEKQTGKNSKSKLCDCEWSK